MVRPDDRANDGEQVDRLEEVVADDRVRPHQVGLLGVRPPGFRSTRSGMPILPMSCSKRSEPDRLDLLFAEAKRESEPHREHREPLAVAAHAFLARLDRVGQRARERRSEQPLAEIALASAGAVERLLDGLLQFGAA